MGLNNGILTKPIAISEISQCLGVASQALSVLCTSGQINEKSKHKPIDSDSTSELTEAQRQAKNYGHTMFTYNHPGDAIVAVVKGENFPYGRPQTRYRILDFNGYDHNAGLWFPCSPMNSSYSEDAAVRFDFQNILDIFDLDTVSGFDPNSGNIQLGFILSDGEFTNNKRSVYWYPMTGDITISNLVANGVYSIRGGVLSVGTWYAYPAISTGVYTQGQLYYINANTVTSGQWWPFPFSEISSISITKALDDIDRISISLNSYSLNDTSDPYEFTLSQVYVTVSNGNSAAKTVVIDAYVNGVSGRTNLTGATQSIAANGSANVCIQSGATSRFEVAIVTNIQLVVQYYVSGQATKYKTVTFNVGKGKD